MILNYLQIWRKLASQPDHILVHIWDKDFSDKTRIITRISIVPFSLFNWLLNKKILFPFR